jgi:DNA-binding LacI/PurR family transcriptional regulator
MSRSAPKQGRPVSLKMLAEHLDLSPATVSFVLNNAPNRSIPEATRERVRAAAREFNYQPSMVARLLQGKRSQTIGILLPELGEGYHAQVLSGAADIFMREGYFFFTAHHRHRKDLVDEYPRLLQQRGVEGILAIDSHIESAPASPTVTVAGHKAFPGVSNIVLDHDRAAELALGHLVREGHRKIAFMRGPDVSSDTNSRWRSLVRMARLLKIPMPESHIIRLEGFTNSPDLGYPGMQQMLMRHRDFTAVVCFNDISAIGAIRALHDGGLQVPQDVSVIGFDDLTVASYFVPSLTTIRQPLAHMGASAANMLLKKIRGEQAESVVKIEPELILRESTAKLPGKGPTNPGTKRRFKEKPVNA